MEEKKAALEAALYVADDPIDTDEIADVLNLGSKGYVQMVVDELQEDLKQDERGLELIETDGGYELQVKEAYVDEVKDLAPHQDLGDATLRTLSIIAYNTPVKQSKIIEIRGNRAYSQIKELRNRGLIEAEKDGRTNVLDVTPTFLDYFGLDDIEEFRASADAAPASDYLDDDGDKSDEEESSETETSPDEHDDA